MAFDIPGALRVIGRFILIVFAVAACSILIAGISVPAAAFALAFVAVVFGSFAGQAAAEDSEARVRAFLALGLLFGGIAVALASHG